MNPIDFFKYHGLGNDFILVDATDRPDLTAPGWPALAKVWCDRRFGIGADGVLLLCAPSPGTLADVRMRIFNSDGTEAQMCGNGIRCVARYMLDHRAWPGRSLRVHTGRGVLDITWTSQPAGGRFTVNMGPPALGPDDIPVRAAPARVLDLPLDVLAPDPGSPGRAAIIEIARELAPLVTDGSPRFSCISMGNPHAVLFVRDPAAVPLERLGPAIESHPAFPERTNVHFVKLAARDHAIIRTWERGAGATLACGTGACAVLVAGALTGQLDDSATVTVPGGDLDISWLREPAGSQAAGVYMSGPAAEAFRGSITIP